MSEPSRSGSGKKSGSAGGRQRHVSPKSGKGPQKTPSPTRKGSGKERAKTGPELKSAMRKGSGDKKKKQTTLRPPDTTDSGLKIVDLSGQGMTIVPPSIVTARDISELCMAGNNLRSLPVEISKLTTLTKLDLSKNGIRCTGSQDYSGLPAEMAELTNLTELKISECNLPYVPPAIWRMSSLRFLDISRNKINFLSPEVGELVNLEKLNLQQTNITTLPPEIAFCQELEEILLWGNVITSLPETLPEMLKLTKLAVNFRNFCVGLVDTYNEGLLRKGQIKSEHIPLVVFELATLEVLDLEDTKINNLPDVSNIGLNEFYLSRNFLQAVPASLFNLTHLTVLDLSQNMINTVSEDIGRIQSLVVLKLNKNNIDRIPINIGKLINLEELNLAENRITYLPIAIKGLVKLKALYVEKNQLTNLPDEVCSLECLETLDITENRISALPIKMHQLKNITMAHSFTKLSKFGLWLHKNPLVQPPPEIWKTERPEKIFDYLKKLAIIKTENLQRQKLLMLGSSQCGKTSLINALVHRKAMLTKGEEDKTRVLEQTPWKTDNNVEFMINDFGGDPAYKMIYSLFMDAKAVVLLVYDHSTYTADLHQEVIGQWLDLFNMYMPGAVIKLVGTHLDSFYDPLIDEAEQDENGNFSADIPLYSGDEAEAAQSDEDVPDSASRVTSTPVTNANISANKSGIVEELVKMKVDDQLQAHRTSVEQQLSLVEMRVAEFTKGNTEGSANNPQYKHLLAQKKRLEFLLKHPLRILPSVSVVSSSEGLRGISDFVESIELMAIDRDLFPHAQRSIPDDWNRLRATLKQRKTYYLHWTEVEDTANTFVIKNERLLESLQYFHDTGEIVWYRDHPALSNIVFHRPRVLVDILAALFRHDLSHFLNYQSNKVFMSKGNFSEADFEVAKDIFLRNGQVSRPLINCFWFYERLSQEKLADLLKLVPKLQLGYSIPEPKIPIKGHFYDIPLLALPWYNSEKAGEEFQALWNNLAPTDNDKSQILTVTYNLPLGIPAGLFERIVCFIQELADTRTDWKDTVYATTGTVHFQIHKSCLDTSDRVSITLKVLGRESSGKSLLKEMTGAISDLLLRTPGLVWNISANDRLWKSHTLYYDFRAVQFQKA